MISRYDKYIKGKEAEIEDLVKKGAVDAEIARYVGCCPNTFSAMKNESPELLRILQEGRRDKCLTVRNALYKRAIGYTEWEEEQKILMGKDGKPKGDIQVTRKKKHFPPDPSAARLFLTQYQPDFSDAGEYQDELKKVDAVCKIRNTEHATGRIVDSRLKGGGQDD